jgi:hypothetical protein
MWMQLLPTMKYEAEVDSFSYQITLADFENFAFVVGDTCPWKLQNLTHSASIILHYNVCRPQHGNIRNQTGL